MKYKNEQELKQQLRKRVEYDLGRKSWHFNGIKFNTTSSYFTGEFFTRVEYVCDLRHIQATVIRYSYPEYYEIIGEKAFSGDDAISECIEWTTETLTKVHKILTERLAPYASDKAMYDRIANRPLFLQGD